MADTLVQVEAVSKKFSHSLKRSLWYGLLDLGAELLGATPAHARLRRDEFWAVRQVSFELCRGETLGIIGANGAGKTTLLRMLNGLIKPDSGRIEIRGRMQALIALGAGFNPLLSGRENIYVNAAVLGISKAEINRRFDQIVAFSGLEEFLDMPVQSYSSGMAVRLGFAVAAHLDPDILLVDEVLAVGDLAFRTKCQLRIQEMRSAGVAIIFVSHNLHTVSHICTRALTLDKGRVIFSGDTGQAIDVYRDTVVSQNALPSDGLRAGSGEIRIHKVELLNQDGAPQHAFGVGERVRLRMHYRAEHPVPSPVFNLSIKDLNGDPVTGLRTDTDGLALGILVGDGSLELDIPAFNLLPNIYSLRPAIFHADGVTYYDRLDQSISLTIRGGMEINGLVYLPHAWRVSGQG